ncbi:MAG: CRISPR-associated helicase Cas3' [Caldilineaceae bacterium]|jgi:CRISPR-associated endonuclease/helicase Cas3|nr:CRISPR-associated helicase Cas3' [Caldilineaceae bacterium]
MALYPYQERVKEHVLHGRSVIIQAPTGTGKTRAALAPYVEAFYDLPPETLPRKCIYSAPMRVLANQFYIEYADLTAKYQRLYAHEPIRTSIQTGEQPNNPTFRGDLIFATIDQSLSSALAVPYSLSPGMGNLNAGAFYSSYLVFDEFHLFPQSGEDGVAGAMTTTLTLLMNLRGIVPFVLMTATFSSTMLQELASLLDAEVVQVSPAEYLAIASGNGQRPRSRSYTIEDAELSAQAVLAAHHTRSIAICNQVQRAQNLYQALQELAGEDVTVMLLHSRFTPEDRRSKEEWLRQEFGKENDKRSAASAILVATQVVEVGLDVTCEHLHTEVAPANAVFQRAGRCARYPGEQGVVHVYNVPIKQTHSGEERRDYLPYPQQLSAATWASLLPRSGQTLDFTAEQVIIDEVHTDSDRRLLDAMQRQKSLLRQEIEAAMRGERALRTKLIRRIDNITVLAAPTPAAVGDPFKASGFGLWRGTVKGLLKTLQNYAQGWQPEDDEQNWLMRLPIADERDADDPMQPVTYRWLEVHDATLLDETAVVVVNCAFCAYDGEVGFRIVPPEQGGWSSPPGERKPRNSQGGYSYQLESYPEHIGAMLQVYQREFATDYRCVQARLAKHWNLPADGLDRAIRLAIALHDLAKMDERWQRWVRLYQQGIGEAIAADYMAVHTTWSPNDPLHIQAKQAANRQCKRPPHAAEGAVAGARIVDDLAGDPRLGRAVVTAIARHHSATAGSLGEYRLHSAATAAALAALEEAGFAATDAELLMSKPPIQLEQVLIEAGDFEQTLFYFWIVRMLRLCDGLSQEENP